MTDVPETPDGRHDNQPVTPIDIADIDMFKQTLALGPMWVMTLLQSVVKWLLPKTVSALQWQFWKEQCDRYHIGLVVERYDLPTEPLVEGEVPHLKQLHVRAYIND